MKGQLRDNLVESALKGRQSAVPMPSLLGTYYVALHLPDADPILQIATD